MNGTTYGTISTGGTTFALTTNSNDRPAQSPKGLIATQAVETKAGWLGLVYVDKRIVFESPEPHEESADAIDEANQRVVSVIASLFETGADS